MTEQKRNDLLESYDHSIRHGSIYVCALCGQIIKIAHELEIELKKTNKMLLVHKECLQEQGR